jgi:hypothetical protein
VWRSPVTSRVSWNEKGKMIWVPVNSEVRR